MNAYNIYGYDGNCVIGCYVIRAHARRGYWSIRTIKKTLRRQGATRFRKERTTWPE